ncbi:MAG TPA: TIGR04283 family arsenosugar biosynthesis glycosyltransferase [Gemmataceae bacterium]|nr:TIGR04283 family arsenosugar biosynthesis glycosyltransferase [Gemmataceae bacterium]
MSVSVIIPTWNEAGCLADTIRALRRQGPLEVLVADGGSTDATRQAAVEADCFLEAPRGRGSQMNAGAAQARGDVLLFLHADCTLEDGALAEAERLLRRCGVAAGCFTMTVNARGLLYRWIDAAASARVRLAGLIYGDQGLFLRRQLFEHLGGFPPLRLMEDVFFSRRLARCGRLVMARRRIWVSPRRWQRAGIVRQTLRNWTLLTLAVAGVHPDRLAELYPAVR